jgi:hypothetical protein
VAALRLRIVLLEELPGVTAALARVKGKAVAARSWLGARQGSSGAGASAGALGHTAAPGWVACAAALAAAVSCYARHAARAPQAPEARGGADSECAAVLEIATHVAELCASPAVACSQCLFSVPQHRALFSMLLSCLKAAEQQLLQQQQHSSAAPALAARGAVLVALAADLMAVWMELAGVAGRVGADMLLPYVWLLGRCCCLLGAACAHLQERQLEDCEHTDRLLKTVLARMPDMALHMLSLLPAQQLFGALTQQPPPPLPPPQQHPRLSAEEDECFGSWQVLQQWAAASGFDLRPIMASIMALLPAFAELQVLTDSLNSWRQQQQQGAGRPAASVGALLFSWRAWAARCPATRSHRDTDAAQLLPDAAAPSTPASVSMAVLCSSPAFFEWRQRLGALGAALASLPCAWACNNPRCTNMAGDSEWALVCGRSCVCGGCRRARYCSAACQAACWAAGREE